jgi:hypothetical protein
MTGEAAGLARLSLRPYHRELAVRQKFSRNTHFQEVATPKPLCVLWNSAFIGLFCYNPATGTNPALVVYGLGSTTCLIK